MRFTQIKVVRWKEPGGREGYTLFALGEDGSVYKSIPKRRKAQHQGWLALSGDVLPVDFHEQSEPAAAGAAEAKQVSG